MELNGCPLSDSIRQLSDHTYRLYELGALHPYGYIYDFVLTPDCFPEVGDNTVQEGRYFEEGGYSNRRSNSDS